MIAGEIDWKEVAAALKTSRSAKSVQNAALRMGLRAPVERRRQSGGNWHAQGRKQGKKGKKRKAAAKGSPAATSPDAPPPRRASVQASSQIQQGEAEGAELDRELAGELGKVVGITKEANRHLAWAFYFADTLGAPAEEHWDGRGGTVSQIAEMFHVKMGSRGSIRSVLVDVTECLEAGAEYSGGRSVQPRAQALISTDSEEANIIADCMEDKMGIRQTAAEVNFWRVHVAQPPRTPELGVTCVWSCYCALDKEETAVLEISQGKTDPEAPWSKARYCWVTFLLCGRSYYSAYIKGAGQIRYDECVSMNCAQSVSIAPAPPRRRRRRRCLVFDQPRERVKPRRDLVAKLGSESKRHVYAKHKLQQLGIVHLIHLSHHMSVDCLRFVGQNDELEVTICGVQQRGSGWQDGSATNRKSGLQNAIKLRTPPIAGSRKAGVGL
eukprot:COSAG04_NODE_1302_length_7312_cov_2.782289_5_plen_439_part_00